jgi:hypothetical protein
MSRWPLVDIGLSSDEDLRQLQLQWLRDELWMRRLVLIVAATLPLIGVIIATVTPSVSWMLGLGAGSSIALPLAYFFGRRPAEAPQPVARPTGSRGKSGTV